MQLINKAEYCKSIIADGKELITLNWLGVHPSLFLKTLIKYPLSLYPINSATSDILNSEHIKSSSAF